MKGILDVNINEFNLSKDTKKWLKSRGVQTFRDIICMQSKDILKASNLRDTNRKELIFFVHKNGFRLIKENIKGPLTEEDLCVGDLSLPLPTIKSLIRNNIIKVEDLKKISYEELLTFPYINEEIIKEISIEIGEAKDQPTQEEKIYEKLLSEKIHLVRKLNNAMKLVERLKQENEEIDYSLQQARERLTNVKVKKQR